MNTTDNHGNTALFYAVAGNHYQTVEVLLKLGADANCHNEYGNTPLHKAMITGHKNIDIINLLLNFRADMSALNYYRQTPIFFASRRL